MKKIFTFCAALLAVASMWAYEIDGNIVLDLKNVTVPEGGFTFTEKGGYWDKTYSEDYPCIESAPFMATHLINSDSYSGSTWNGFTVCKNDDVYDYGKPGATDGGWITNQWGCVAGGGIKVDAEGNIVKTTFGTPAVDKDQPFLLGYWSEYSSALGEQTNQIMFNDGNEYEIVGVYVANASWPFYGCIHGDSFARAFDEGDSFKLIAHGMDAEGNEKSKVEIEMISYKDGVLKAVRNWKYWDLSSLGKVSSVYFSMSSTDSGAYGINTSTYFCLDKFMVKKPLASSVENSLAETAIKYDRATQTLTLGGEEFGVVYNAEGQKVMVVESETARLDNLAQGIYVVKTAKATKKIIR